MGAACSNSAEEKRDCFLCSFYWWLNKWERPAPIQPRIEGIVVYALFVGGLTNGSGLLQLSRGKKGLYLCSFCRWLNKREWPAAIQPRIYEICSPWHVCGASGSAYSYPFRAAYAHADLQLCPESFFLQVRSLGL